MEILTNDEDSDTIAWLPHGRSFIIYKKKKFAAQVLVKYFKVGNFQLSLYLGTSNNTLIMTLTVFFSTLLYNDLTGDHSRRRSSLRSHANSIAGASLELLEGPKWDLIFTKCS